LARRLGALFGPDARSAGQSLAALGINSTTSLAAGAFLGSITDTFAQYPGLLVMVPAAIGLRGNVFSALGSRLSTAIHTGTYAPSLRPRTVLGDNVGASLLLSVVMALVLAVVATVLATVFALGHASVLDLATISVVGGLLASLVVLAATLLLVVGASRFDWDLDNLVAPVVSTLGDLVTVPALWAATVLVDHGDLSTAGGGLLVVATVGGAIAGWRSPSDRLRRIVRESLPVLVLAGCLSALAGVALEHQLDTFEKYPALLVLVPPFVSSAGALGGILASRVSTGLHLGTILPRPLPTGAVRRDAGVLAAIAVPVYAFNAVGAGVVARLLGQASPGVAILLGAALLGAAGAVAFVVAIAYYGSVAAVRLDVDPDTYGIPIVTSSVDVVGVVVLLAAATAVGL
jgi:mgtE-like transporter